MREEIREKLEAFITKRGMRRTPQRMALLETAFDEDEHFTAEELFERIKRKNIKVSRATLYRSLALLVDAGLLTEVELGTDEKTYDPNFHDKPSHNHLICVDCKKVIEFEDSHLELLNDCITKRMGFQPKTQSIRIEANCEALRKTGVCKELIASRLSGRKIRS